MTTADVGCGCSPFAINAASSRVFAGVRRSDSFIDKENGESDISQSTDRGGPCNYSTFDLSLFRERGFGIDSERPDQ